MRIKIGGSSDPFRYIVNILSFLLEGITPRCHSAFTVQSASYRCESAFIRGFYGISHTHINKTPDIGKRCSQPVSLVLYNYWIMPASPSVTLILIDGLRPDGLLQAHTPTLDLLIASGAHTLSARTVMPSITLPCHVSLFLGVPPEQHGVTTNLWKPRQYTADSNPAPTGLVEALKAAGKVTAFFYNWEELRDVSRPDSLSASFFLNGSKDPHGTGDLELAELAAGWLASHPVDFAFIYLGYTDTAGHDYGWMSEHYLMAIANTDRCIDNLLSVLPEDGTLIVTSDHGGHDQSHGTDCDEDMIVPFIICGPGIPAGYRIEHPVNITDIAPTIASLLGILPPSGWIGQPLKFGLSADVS